MHTTGNQELDNRLSQYPHLQQYVDNLYNYGLFHDPNNVNNYSKNHVPFLDNYNQRTLVFDCVKSKIKLYGESSLLHKNQSDGRLFKQTSKLNNSHIDLIRTDIAEGINRWVEENIKNNPSATNWYNKNKQSKLDKLKSFKVEDLKDEENKEIRRRAVGSITEKLLTKQSYNKNLKTDIPVYNNNKIVGNLDLLNKNGIYIDLKTKDRYKQYYMLDLKVSGNYFNTLHLINCFYNLVEEEDGLKLKYIGYINLVKELYNKSYDIKEEVFTNESGRETSRYKCFKFNQSKLIEESPMELTLSEIFNV